MADVQVDKLQPLQPPLCLRLDGLRFHFWSSFMLEALIEFIEPEVEDQRLFTRRKYYMDDLLRHFSREISVSWLRIYLAEKDNRLIEPDFPSFGFTFYAELKDLILNFDSCSFKTQRFVFRLVKQFAVEEEWQQGLNEMEQVLRGH